MKHESDRIDKKRLEDWLLQNTTPKSGFQDWYTLRKRSIMQSLSIGRTGDEYWTLIGRLLELKQLAKMSEDQLNQFNKTKV